MEPAEEQRIEGAQLSELEVHAILIVPAIALEVVIKVRATDQRQGMLAVIEGVGIGGARLEVEATRCILLDGAVAAVRHHDSRDSIYVLCWLVEVAIAVAYETLIHRTEALGDVGLLGADKFGQVIIVLDRSEE